MQSNHNPYQPPENSPSKPTVESPPIPAILLLVLFVAGMVLGPLLIPQSMFSPSIGFGGISPWPAVIGGLIGVVAYCSLKFWMRNRKLELPPESNTRN